MDEWLVSVVKEGKVVDLYYSEGLRDIGTIRAIHKDCEIETMLLRTQSKPIKVAEEDDTKFIRWQSRPVRCVETGELYLSVAECAFALGVGRNNVYKAIQRGHGINGKHYEYNR